MEKVIFGLCDYLVQDVDNIKDKPDLLVAIKSHIRNTGGFCGEDSDKIVDKWFYNLTKV